MFDPSGITLGQVSSTIRDFSIVGTLVVMAWKARGVYESVSQFFDRTLKHMNTMEMFATTVVDNHLKHIEDSLKQMSDNQERILSGRDVIHVIDESEPE